MIGDYESLLMLQEFPPTPFCPSMRPETIKKFVVFKRSPKDTPLVSDDGTPAKDVNGKEMLCSGGWNAPTNVDQFLSAVSAVHSARNQDGPYQDVCTGCVEDDLKLRDGSGGLGGCRFHRGQPWLWRRGNPKNSSLIHNLVNKNAKDGHAYQSEGATPLTPHELLLIRSRLVSTGKLDDLQLWTMILIGCRLGLREAELADLKHTDVERNNTVNWDITIQTPTGEIDAIALSIKESRTLMLFF